MGQAPDGGGPRNQRQTVIASASVPVTTELGAVVGKQGATINKIKDGTRTRISHLEPDRRNGHLFPPSIFQVLLRE